MLRIVGTYYSRVLYASLLAFAFGVSTPRPMIAAPQAGQTNLPCASAMTTADMRNCENERYEKAEQELNAVYRKLMDKLDETGKNKLRAAQRAWLKFRAANAELQADAARGGTLAEVIRITVLADMTEARAAELGKSMVP